MTVTRVDVLLELDPVEVPFAAQAEDAGFRRRASLALLGLVESLGIPADPVVEVTPRESTRAVRLSIGGQHVPYPPELLTCAWLAVSPASLAAVPLEPPIVGSDFPVHWLAHTTEERFSLPLWSAFLERVIVGIAAERPSLFFGEAQAKAYANAAGIDRRATRLLRPLLDAGISLADHQRVREALADAAGAPTAEALELVRARLVRHRIEVYAAPSYLQELGQLAGASADGDVESAITSVQKAITGDISSYFADDLGLDIPAIDVHDDRHLRRREIRFVVNGRAALPVRGLRRGELLVGTTAEQLVELEVTARPAWNPGWDQPGAIASDADRAKLDGTYAIWNQFDFVVLAMSGEIRRRAHLLLTTDDVHHRLVELVRRRPQLGCLIGRSHELAPRMAPTLRALVRENVSIRNLETMLAELALAEDSFDDVDAGRRALAPSITRRHTFGRTLVAYLVEPDFTDAARARGGALTDAEAEAIRSAVWRELSYLPQVVRRPVILTDADTRGSIRRILEPELPDIAVLSYSELDPDVNVQPIARISL